ncbi:hypothetical protein LMG23992_04039 [Cupriavidus laharis]|uniref:Cyclic nucleotide-binding domain-containing protein n=1 Tax=Cupriavidus laharis TaxID=151654 RepID=A0ABN7Z1L9_9BURK|nr:Crp/Fnr family transcriptional regulator [Cupriavidus laharis]CAG9179672.1 hypothetical protein LMG23992_04039 [Cupriavidus laharis]
MNWQTLVRAYPALASVPSALGEAAERLELQPGETLFRLGDRPVGIHFVMAGEVRLVRRAPNGAEIILQRSRGGFVAEASLDTKAYHCDAVVTEAGAALRFSARAFRNALEEDSTFGQTWRMLLAHEVRKLRAQCERLSLHTAAERIIHYLESEGTVGVITLNKSRKAWAAELGLTHEALYRTLRRLQADGILDVTRHRIAICRQSELRHGQR